MDELEALAILVNIAPLESEKLRLLVEEFGSAAAALRAPSTQLARLPGFGGKLCGAISRWEQEFSWRHDLELAARRGVELIPYWDSRYPSTLRDLPDHPVLLYVRGTLAEADRRALSIVGTQRNTIYGGEMASRLSREIAALGVTVISGLSRGIDTIVHRAALEEGRTVAIIGSGLDALYPKESEELANEIAKYGALISEFPMTTPADRVVYTRRNRLISGLGGGVILAEAPLKSSAMATMRHGWKQGRKLFALPGRLDAETFRGNHLLIKERKAQLIECGQDAVDACTQVFNSADEGSSRKHIPLPEPTALHKIPRGAH